MNNKTLRFIVSLGILSIIGIIVIQSYWFKKAFDLKEKQFVHNVTIALQNTAEALLTYNNLPIPLESIVYQVSGNYYVVPINGEIKTSLLEFLLKKELEKRNVLIDFEYGVFNCQTQRMVYGNYVSFQDQKNISKTKELPVWQHDKFYFGVFFPNKNYEMINQMDVWLFLSFVLLLVCFFFSYSMVAILKQKRLSEVQRDFINNMTHEFKTPISTIQITTDLLKKPAICQQTAQADHYLSVIQYETSRLKNHVEKVLQVALFDNNKLNFNFETVDIQKCIYETIQSLQLQLTTRQGKITTELKATNTMIKADKTHLINVIFNLLDNALKYSHSIPEISISIENINNSVIIKIKDNGIGIEPAHIKKIFDKFYRVPTGNIHNVKGFGLGLFYVKNIIKHHKGSIKVESKINEGSVFTITLPTIRKYERNRS